MSESYDAWEKLAEAGQDADAIEAYIRAYDYVSFAELKRRLEPYMETKGTIALHMPNDPNIILWAGMSDRFADAMVALLQEHRILPEAASLMVYMIDGGMLRMPIVKRIGKTPRKKEGWLPVTLRIWSELPAPTAGRPTP